MSQKKPTRQSSDFDAHVIFHGPKLRIRESGSETKEKNDFLGEITNSAADTHVFSGDGYKGALIQRGEELHLHIKSEERKDVRDLDASDLVDRVARSVGFAFGFHPWPVYRELRRDHVVVERWLSPRLGLSQSFLAPVSEALWHTYFSERTNPLFSIIPTVARGLATLRPNERERIETLLWHVHSSDMSKLPRSTQMLILCSALDGMVEVIAGVDNKIKRLATDKLWRRANDTLGFSWESWLKGIFALRGKYRHDLSHGRLWLPEERDFAEDMGDYARLGCAFMTLIAARCGYEGPLMADPYQRRKVIIRSLRPA
jgi:hypothetical protein